MSPAGKRLQLQQAARERFRLCNIGDLFDEERPHVRIAQNFFEQIGDFEDVCETGENGFEALMLATGEIEIDDVVV